AWVSELAPRERRAFGACVGGWALDAMDVQMYSFVIPALIATWGITRAQAGVLGTAALLVSAVGGWLAGWIADRFGRVRTLQVAILRSEEHTSELQSRENLVCRLLLEKKKNRLV